MRIETWQCDRCGAKMAGGFEDVYQLSYTRGAEDPFGGKPAIDLCLDCGEKVRGLLNFWMKNIGAINVEDLQTVMKQKIVGKPD